MFRAEKKSRERHFLREINNKQAVSSFSIRKRVMRNYRRVSYAKGLSSFGDKLEPRQRDLIPTAVPDDPLDLHLLYLIGAEPFFMTRNVTRRLRYRPIREVNYDLRSEI